MNTGINPVIPVALAFSLILPFELLIRREKRTGEKLRKIKHERLRVSEGGIM